MINLLNDETPTCASNIKDSHNLFVLTLYPHSSEVLITHHFTEIGGSLLRSEKRLLALNGFGPLAKIARFKSAEDMFSFVIDLAFPSKTSFSNFDVAAEFSILKKSSSIERLRNIIVLLPFIAAVILIIPSSSPSDWTALMKAAAESMKTELEGDEDCVAKDFDDAVLRTLRWLWCINSDDLTPPCLGFRNDDLSSAWSKNIHNSCMNPQGETNPNPSCVTGPSNEVLNSMQ